MNALQWMAWTPPVAVFFIGLGVLLVGMTVWEINSPNVPRRGLLPLVTTRGDRLFIGLMAAAIVNLGWAGLTDAHQWGGAVLGGVVLIMLMRWG
jgi:predicted small integral membrane protein